MFPNRVQWRLTNMKNAIVLLALILFTSGCTVGPNYKRPKVDVPGGFRGAPSQEVALANQNATQEGANDVENSASRRLPPADKPAQSQSSEPSFGDQKWWEVFQDAQLQ